MVNYINTVLFWYYSSLKVTFTKCFTLNFFIYYTMVAIWSSVSCQSTREHADWRTLEIEPTQPQTSHLQDYHKSKCCCYTSCEILENKIKN